MFAHALEMNRTLHLGCAVCLRLRHGKRKCGVTVQDEEKHSGTVLAGGHGWKVLKVSSHILPPFFFPFTPFIMNLLSLKRGIDAQNFAPTAVHQCHSVKKKRLFLCNKRPDSCFTASLSWRER